MGSNGGETRFRRAANATSTLLDEEVVCLNLDTGAYTGMRDVARTIWERLDEPRELDDIVDTVMERYEVNRDSASADTKAFIDELLEAGLAEEV